MICRKCKKEIPGNRTICLYCGTVVKKDNTSKTSNVKASKGVRNKYLKEDYSELVGSEVTKKDGAIIKLQKKPKKVQEIERKNYVNYIDYKEAKDEQINKRYIGESQSVLGKFFNTSNIGNDTMVSLDKIKKRTKLDEFKAKNSNGGIDTGSKITKGSRSKLENRLNVEIVNNQKVESKNLIELGPVTKIDERATFSSPKIELTEKDIPQYDIPKERVVNLSFLPYVFLSLLWVAVIGFMVLYDDNEYYFSEDSNTIVSEAFSGNPDLEEMGKYEGVSKSGQSGGSSSEGVTSIVYDNQYLKQFVLKDIDDAITLIEADSVKQKKNCPQRITNLETKIINNYKVTAVNLCEMDYEFAEELAGVIEYIYVNYPTARSYLTNVTLANVENMSFIAAFMPVFTFATSNTSTEYPIAVKTQILLNAKYFLNTDKIYNSVSYGTKSGYFPPNATRSSTVAHEFGHFLSYVALLNYHDTKQLNFVKAGNVSLLYDVYDDFNDGSYSKKLLEEAYEIYKYRYDNFISFTDFRGSISQYALSKDKSGNYIYDETIAEAFHDWYLNGNNAKDASKVIMEVLNKYL